MCYTRISSILDFIGKVIYNKCYVCLSYMLCLHTHRQLYIQILISKYCYKCSTISLPFTFVRHTQLHSTPLRSALPENCRACDTDSLDLCETQSQHAAHTVAHSALHKYTHSRLPFSQSQSEFASSTSLSPSLALSRSVFVAQFDLSNMAFAFGFAFALAMVPATALALALALPLTLGLALTGSVWGSVSGAAFCHCRLSIVDWIVVARLSMLIVAACCCCCRCVLGPPPSGRAARDGHNLN